MEKEGADIEHQLRQERPERSFKQKCLKWGLIIGIPVMTTTTFVGIIYAAVTNAGNIQNSAIDPGGVHGPTNGSGFGVMNKTIGGTAFSNGTENSTLIY